MDAINETLIIRLVGDRIEELVDKIAVEAPITLEINGEVLVSLLCTPTDLEAMAVGFFLSEGLFEKRDALLSVVVDEKKSTVSINLANLPADWQKRFHKKTITSGCGKGITFTDVHHHLQGGISPGDGCMIAVSVLRAVLKQFKNISTLFATTGGVHSACLSTAAGKILFFTEDIGRHNAVDKLIGKAFLDGVALHDKILFTSGRVSGEIMTKVIRSRVPVIVSRAAPTCLSISSAEDHGVTLVAFARGQRMNIYTHPSRIFTEG
jgi:FdhD protein